MTIQFLLMLTEMTGWNVQNVLRAVIRPVSKVAVVCRGTLMRLAPGFFTSFSNWAAAAFSASSAAGAFYWLANEVSCAIAEMTGAEQLLVPEGYVSN